MFTFHLRNAGDQMISWDPGCAMSIPIVLHLPEGDLPAGPWPADICGHTCDEVYAGTAFPGGCTTDCGLGYAVPVAPGALADIVWDRRVYTAHTFDAACRSFSSPTWMMCALGRAVAPAAAQSGTIKICPGTVPWPGGCQNSAGMSIDSRSVEFTVDTTGSEAIIEVR
jgi:hypothetical protein